MFFYNTQSQGGPTHNICFKEEDPLLFSLHLFFTQSNLIQFLTRLQWAWAECHRTWDRCDRTSRRLGQSFSALPVGLGILHTVGRVWGAVSSCFQQLGVWGQPTDVLSGWQWHLALTCPLGSRCWGMFLSNPFRRRLTDSLSSWYCKEGRPFRSFSILFISCPSFLLMTLSMSHTACVSNCEPFQCLKMLDYELCSLDMLSTLLMTFDMSVVVSRFVTAPAVVSVE